MKIFLSFLNFLTVDNKLLAAKKIEPKVYIFLLQKPFLKQRGYRNDLHFRRTSNP